MQAKFDALPYTVGYKQVLIEGLCKVFPVAAQALIC